MSKATDNFNTWMLPTGGFSANNKELFAEYIVTESQSAMIETLISRHKLGYREWTIPKTSATTKTLKSLSELGVLKYRPQSVEAAYYAELTNDFLEANSLGHIVERKGESHAIETIIQELANHADWNVKQFCKDRAEGKHLRESRDTSAESEESFEKIREAFLSGGNASARVIPNHEPEISQVPPPENSRDWLDLRPSDKRTVHVHQLGAVRVTTVTEALS